jgi:predicted NAD/FAD-binding protein
MRHIPRKRFGQHFLTDNSIIDAIVRAIDPAKVRFEVAYTHPIYDGAAIASQSFIKGWNGANHTHYCGAYMGYGFHEDGVLAALDAVRPLGAHL